MIQSLTMLLRSFRYERFLDFWGWGSGGCGGAEGAFGLVFGVSGGRLVVFWVENYRDVIR